MSGRLPYQGVLQAHGEGYAAAEMANKQYMANLMDYHMNPDLRAGERHSKEMQFSLEQVALRTPSR
ncbi:hypothetical protein [Streptomyces sp. McG3]|uniref:hypothetical protein n=1 Tax=Streptomyces sp. McG3 TaxID=2725483 RepID=UPI001BE6D7C5|nr:hypothetical protein [Streptomyces sp. McG3]MBT2897608.1 hypothetical protein [Streptomyces sp. McG3]